MALPILGALFFILGAPGMLQGLAGMFPPFPAAIARRGYRDRPDLLPTSDEIIHLRIRNEIDDRTYRLRMMETGINEETADKLLSAAQTYMSALDYITLWRREEMKDDELDEQLRKLGFVDDQITKLKAVTLYYPNPIDIVRFAVRDAYTPSTVEAYGLDEDMPDDYLEAGRKAGLSDELARLYWRSHWELPSPTQVYEMLHRGLMTEEEVTNFLRIADYMPYYRDKLQAISYNPLTRVDIRRMYQMGVIGLGEVKKAYKNLGYDDYNAQLMTDFTSKLNEMEETRTPKNDVLKAYTQGLISEAEAASDLSKLGYSQEAIKTILETEDEKIKQEIIDLAADAVIDEYNQGVLDLPSVKAKLTELGVKPRMMELILQRELAQAAKRQKHATKADLDRWFKMGFISVDSYIGRMKSLGYNVQDINDFIAENEVEYVHTLKQDYPYSQALRDYVNGRIGITEYEGELNKAYKDAEVVDTLLRVATMIKG